MTMRGTMRGVGAWVLLAAMGGCYPSPPASVVDAKVSEEPTALPDAAGIDAPDAPADATADVPMDVSADMPADTAAPPDAMDAEVAAPDAEATVPDAEAAVPDADAPETEPTCPTPLLRCAGACVDPSTDPMHCGGCGVTCPSGTVCAGGDCGSPRIHALHPPLVDGASGRLVLEGAFGGSVSVTFPGAAAPVTATVLGPGRVEVMVPPDATAGALRVSTAGASATSPIRFRRASFALGLQPFRARYEQADYARQTPSLATARVHAATFQSGLWLYLLGGADASGAALNGIERAMINADGTLGAFQTTSATLGAPREGAASVRVGDAVYLLGGASRGTRLSTIERATVNADGVLGGFTLWTGELAHPRSGHAAEVIGGYVYVFGGGDERVERAAIGADGRLGPFVDTGARTLEGRSYASAQVIGASVYLMGGMNGDAASRTIERAEVRGNGAVTPFAMAGMLRGPRAGAASVVLGNRVFVAGGIDGATALATLERADLSADGSLSAFVAYAESALSRARHGASAAQVGNYWYLVGGAESEPLRGIDRAEVNVSGMFGMPRNLPRPGLAGQRHLPTAVAIGRYVYVLGGSGPGGFEDSRGTERSPVLEDGSLGAFEGYPALGAATQYRVGAEVAVVGTSLYLFGGRRNTSTYIDTTLRVQIRDDGSLESPTEITADTSLTFGRAMVLDDRVCIFGGTNSSGTSAIIGCARINPSGTIERFAAQTVQLPAPRNYTAGVWLGDAVYLAGGSDGSTILPTIVRCAIPADVTSCALHGGRLSRPLQLPFGALVGNALIYAGGQSSASSRFGADVERAPILDGALGSAATVAGVALPLAIYYHSTLVIENRLWVLGGETAGGTAGSHQVIELR